MGEGLGLGVGLGLGNHIAISTRGVIIWQGVENGHNTGMCLEEGEDQSLVIESVLSVAFIGFVYGHEKPGKAMKF